MDCLEAQQQILEALDESYTSGDPFDLNHHLRECEACLKFFELQSSLDRRLTTSITAPALSPTFRKSLAKKVRGEPLSAWPEFLPDAAHIAGCACAIVFCLAVLPFPPATVIVAGGAITLATYLLQSAIIGSLELEK